ncbi:rRNA biogenesis protein rrp36 [Golovinomyces cichoracearum]|uniref:rRNA biogenesis protein RRP36 n=1 Tax=Golovinomyces cichoracearum TaxID=62708 RepID=A0A420ITG1_9PEZI|nr:rRNA biogenesis protein rrp36 [Golovinomyces cichoracearum]
MSGMSRNIVHDTLQQRVRVRREASEEIASSSSSEFLTAESDDELSDGNAGEESSPHSEEETEEEEDTVDEKSSISRGIAAAASVSFGALAKAQSNLNPSHRSTRQSRLENPPTGLGIEEKKRSKKFKGESHRSSSHAPAEISSKRAVTRRRDVVLIAKRQPRDPRFEPLGSSLRAIPLTKAYAFLDEYRETEMKELKAAIKATKDDAQKENLKKTLLVMESRKKAKLRKLKEQEVLDRHRKQEKELVKQGKQPFYLKKAEQKKQFLLNQFSELKGKKIDRVIERRRKKLASKEKKRLPFARRADV